MKALGKALQAVKDLPLKLTAYAAAGLAAIELDMAAHANTGGGGTATTANVRGALDANQQGLTAVENSSFTGEGAQSAATNFTNVLLYGAGAIGIALVIVGIYQLWKHQKDGEQARGSATQGIAMIVIGGLMTIPAIMTAIAPRVLVGSGT